MFCPSCGSEERQASQYCRACGTDLRPVRVSIERPDSITASAVSAREEIGRAVAEKIREVEDSRDLKRVAEDVLPQIEKFLESYEEKRLRRVRAGVVVAASGFGTGILGLIMSAVLRTRRGIRTYSLRLGRDCFCPRTWSGSQWFAVYQTAQAPGRSFERCARAKPSGCGIHAAIKTQRRADISIADNF